MTASTATVTQRGGAAHRSRPLPGLRALVRKDIAEWVHGSRALVVLAIVSVFMTLAAANMWINAWIIANVPDAAAAGATKMISLDPLANLIAAVASQIFVFATIFVAMSLLVRERESGTLSWIASKPVARSTILASKWLSATAVLWIVAGIVPLVLSAAVVTVLYGIPPVGALAILGIGIGAVIALFVAVALAASTFQASQPAVAGIAFAVLLVPTLLGAIVPFDLASVLPTGILSWSMGVASGASVGLATPIAWLVGMAALAIMANRRMAMLEL
jgi:ABC-type transport system involved in multi-copper enzyme maturation permease subunit